MHASPFASAWGDKIVDRRSFRLSETVDHQQANRCNMELSTTHIASVPIFPCTKMHASQPGATISSTEKFSACQRLSIIMEHARDTEFLLSITGAVQIPQKAKIFKELNVGKKKVCQSTSIASTCFCSSASASSARCCCSNNNAGCCAASSLRISGPTLSWK